MSQESVPTNATHPIENRDERPGGFVAVNFISCEGSYRERFEKLFRSRAHAIDRAPGFKRMFVLRPDRGEGDYLVVSHWESREAFDHWRTSPEFAEGHRRGFEDLRQARERGEQPPMTSRMETYEVLTQ
jgi:heme-degrading monooxygenase HmoA